MALSPVPYAIDLGAAFAQLVIYNCTQATLCQVTSLDATKRGPGFGSSDNPKLDNVARSALTAIGIVKKLQAKAMVGGSPDGGDLVSRNRTQTIP